MSLSGVHIDSTHSVAVHFVSTRINAVTAGTSQGRGKRLPGAAEAGLGQKQGCCPVRGGIDREF